MKIIYIANARIPTEKAHGLQIMKMCEAFASQGLDLELIIPNRINTPKLKGINPFDYYHVKKNFKIKKIKSFDPRFLLIGPSGIYIKFQVLFFIFGLLIYLFFKNNKQENIFYTRDEQLLPLLQLFSKKVVWEAHNLPKHKNFYLKYWHKCYKIISITNGLKTELVKNGLGGDKILVSSDATDLDQFINIKESKEDLRRKLNLPLDKNIITYTGHLYKWKGVQTLVDAMSLLSNNELLVIVGGTDKDIFDLKNSTKGLANILIIGHLPQYQIPGYLKASDILVLPNSASSVISHTYTSPLKLFEYMASERPIIASDLPSIGEILNNYNSILVDPDDSQKLAKAINLVLSDATLSDKISKQSFADVQKYTWSERAKIIINNLL